MDRELMELITNLPKKLDFEGFHLKFIKDVGEGDLNTVLNMCAITNRIYLIPRYIKVFERKRGYLPDFVYSYLALYYMKTLKIRKLREILPKSSNTMKLVVYMQFGLVKEVEEILDKTDLGKEEKTITLLNIKALKGEKIDLNYLKSFESARKLYWILSKAIRGFYLISRGYIEEGEETYKETLNTCVKYDLLPLGIQTAILYYSLTRNVLGLEQIRIICESLGDRLKYLKTLIYRSFVENELIKALDIYRGKIMKIPSLRILYGVITGRETGNTYIKGLWNQCYYLKLVAGNRIWIRMRDLKVFKGNRELKLPRSRKSKVILGLYKVGGKKAVMENAKRIFPNSKHPENRCQEYLSRLKNMGLTACEDDIKISVENGEFLKDLPDLRDMFMPYLSGI